MSVPILFKADEVLLGLKSALSVVERGTCCMSRIEKCSPLHHCSCLAIHSVVLFSKFPLRLNTRCADFQRFAFWEILTLSPRMITLSSTTNSSGTLKYLANCVQSILTVRPYAVAELLHFLFQSTVWITSLPMLSPDWFLWMMVLVRFFPQTLMALVDLHQIGSWDHLPGRFRIPFCIVCRYHIVEGAWTSSVVVAAL